MVGSGRDPSRGPKQLAPKTGYEPGLDTEKPGDLDEKKAFKDKKKASILVRIKLHMSESTPAR